MHANAGSYLAVVDGSIPLGNPGYLTTAGFQQSADSEETAAGAAAVIARGTCAAFGGCRKSRSQSYRCGFGQGYSHRQTGNQRIGMSADSGRYHRCPAHYLTFGTLPELDQYGRPKAFYGTRFTIAATAVRFMTKVCCEHL